MNTRFLRWARVVLTVVLAGAAPASAADGPSYITSDGWSGSGIPGPGVDSPTFWTTAQGAWSEWRPGFDGPTRAEVLLHRIVWNRDNDPAMRVAVRHAGGASERTIDAGAGETGWVSLGVFEFAGDADEGVRLTRASGEGITRTSAVRFDVLGEGARAEVIQSFVLAEPTGGPLVEAEQWSEPPPRFDDLRDPATARAVEGLARRGAFAAEGTGEGSGRGEPGRFRPEEPVRGAAFQAWLAAVAPQAVEGAPAVRGAVSGAQARAALSAGARASGRNLEWAEDLDAAWGVPETEALTRGQAAAAVWRFVQTVVEAGPPVDGSWGMVFEEEFEGTALDTSSWRAEAGAPGHIMSSRWPENVVVDDGVLRLVTKREERGGRAWTTGNIWSHRRFLYGYFEARMKIGGATGLNNAFWLMTDRGQDPNYHFEIDVTEAKYPNRSLMTVHDWHGEHHASGELLTTEENLSEDFHVYGALWTPDEIVWYLDGREVRRVRHDYCRAESPLRLSSAIGRFAGRITEALDGTEQVVDWVRVYEPADAGPGAGPGAGTGNR